MKTIIQRLDEYIAYAEATKRFSDVGFYKELKTHINGKQYEIDMLMMEWCPDEMTKEQVEEWAENQVPAFSNTEIEKAIIGIEKAIDNHSIALQRRKTRNVSKPG